MKDISIKQFMMREGNLREYNPNHDELGRFADSLDMSGDFATGHAVRVANVMGAGQQVDQKIVDKSVDRIVKAKSKLPVGHRNHDRFEKALELIDNNSQL